YVEHIVRAVSASCWARKNVMCSRPRDGIPQPFVLPHPEQDSSGPFRWQRLIVLVYVLPPIQLRKRGAEVIGAAHEHVVRRLQSRNARLELDDLTSRPRAVDQ